MKLSHTVTGNLIALTIITLWFVCLIIGLNFQVNYKDPFTYVLILFQTHLYTGIFITAHDAMHGSISPNKLNNKILGYLCAGLFAFNNYNKLLRNHRLHHKHPATDHDPDYANHGLVKWYYSFMKRYLSIWQVILMAITYNILALGFTESNVFLFWALPSILSTFQLFYFGTFLPHRGLHAPENKHNARSLFNNHFYGFISCYFFSYHYEHHEYPNVPWWQLYKKKYWNN